MTRKPQASQKKPAGPRKRAAERSNEAGGGAAPAAAVESAPSPDSDPSEAAAIRAAAADAVSGIARGIVPDTDVMADPSVVIEMDPAPTGGYVHGRFDVMIRGRAMSVAPIEEIRLQVDDRVTSMASFGQPECAAGAMLPDGTPARQRGFQFNLPRPGGVRTARCKFQIIARTEDGFEYAEDFEIDVDPTAGDPISVIAGPTRLTVGAARPYTVMYIERGTIDSEGVLSVVGWAVSLGPTLLVQIFVDDERISEAKIGGEREDVASVFPAYPKAVFQVSA
jgi:hypothetical protein